jgi:hypothetical protein
MLNRSTAKQRRTGERSLCDKQILHPLARKTAMKTAIMSEAEPLGTSIWRNAAHPIIISVLTLT